MTLATHPVRTARACTIAAIVTPEPEQPSRAPEPEAPAVDERIEAAYSGYHASERKRRAWDSANPGNRASHLELAAAMRSLAAEQLAGAGAILDVGCGTGGWLHELSADVEEARLYGADLLPGRLELAKRNVPGANYVHADARELPFEDGRFALILLFTVLGDLPGPDSDRVVAECDRVLAPGGMLMIYDPRVPNPFNRSTRSIHRHDIALPVSSRTITLLPQIARRLGSRAPRLYPMLARIVPLRSHRLWWYRKPAAVR
jgi:ubiquinone/menaquinone biosynthesis C-methylase UbiE